MAILALSFADAQTRDRLCHNVLALPFAAKVAVGEYEAAVQQGPSKRLNPLAQLGGEIVVFSLSGIKSSPHLLRISSDMREIMAVELGVQGYDLMDDAANFRVYDNRSGKTAAALR